VSERSMHLRAAAVLLAITACTTHASSLNVSSSQAARPGRDINAREIAEVRRILGFATSPDGTWIAYQVAEPSVEKTEIRVIWYVTRVGPGGPEPRKLADGGDVVLTRAEAGIPIGQFSSPVVSWSPDSRRVVFGALKNGEQQLWSASLDGETPVQLTHNAA